MAFEPATHRGAGVFSTHARKFGYLLGYGGTLVSAGLFLTIGRDFSHWAPVWFWGGMALAAAAGALIARRVLSGWITVALVLSLGISLTHELLQPPWHEALAPKAMKRFLAYVFFFSIFTGPWLGARLAPHGECMRRWLALALISLSMGILLSWFFMFDVLDQQLEYSVVGLMALVATTTLSRDRDTRLQVFARPLSLLLVFLVIAVLNDSRSVFLGTFAGIVLWAWSTGWFRGARNGGALALMIVLGLIVQAMRFPYSPIFRFLSASSLIQPADDGAGYVNMKWRILVWKDSFRLWWDHPWLGIGYRAVIDSPSVMATGQYPQLEAYHDLEVHNSWLQVLVRGGLLLWVPYVAAWIQLFRRSSAVLLPFLALWCVFGLTMVSFEAPYTELSLYFLLGLVPLLTTDPLFRNHEERT